MLIDISVRDLHNDMIKPSENSGLASVVDSVTQKVRMLDTTLRSFIPPQVCKMTPKLRQICGCKLCNIPKYMQIDLKILRTIIVIYLQHKYIGRHTHKILFSTTSATHDKDIFF